MERRVGWFLALLALLVLISWVTAWWGVPILAAAWSYGRRPTPPWAVGLAAALAWGALLLLMPLGNVGRLADRLGGIFSVPGVTVLGATLCFAALLGWSGARIAMRPPAPSAD